MSPVLIKILNIVVFALKKIRQLKCKGHLNLYCCHGNIYNDANLLIILYRKHVTYLKISFMFSNHCIGTGILFFVSISQRAKRIIVSFTDGIPDIIPPCWFRPDFFRNIWTCLCISIYRSRGKYEIDLIISLLIKRIIIPPTIISSYKLSDILLHMCHIL